MGRAEIGYHDLQGVDPAYVESLRKQEDTVLRALEKIGHRTPVQWSWSGRGSGNGLFRLVDSADRDSCIAEVLPLDLTLEAAQFEELLTQGKRPCASDFA